MYIIEGLEDGGMAVLTKIHHAAVDGASGAELLTLMPDASPEGDDIPPPPPEVEPEPVPTDAEMLAAAANSLARKPGRMLVLSSRTVRAFGEVTNNPVLTAAGRQLRSQLRGPLGAVLNIGRRREEEVDEASDARPLPGAAPRVTFNGSITPHRSFAFRSVQLETIKDSKNALGATVNDVVMALVSGVLRTYLTERGQLPDNSLVAVVPISVHERSDRPGRNQVSGMFAKLETSIEDPVERLKAIASANSVAKQHSSAIGATLLQDWTQFAAPAVFGVAMRVYASSRLSGARPVHNLVLSNVPVPQMPLYMLGCEVEAMYPLGPIFHGSGLNITVMSLNGKLDVGIVSCPELLPDLWDMADDFQAALDELLGVTG